MTVYTRYETDGIDLLVSPITFASGAGASTMTGATVAAYARNVQSDVTHAANSCTVASATSIRATWTGGTLLPGKYIVQVYATPVGYAIQTIAEIEVVVKEAAGP